MSTYNFNTPDCDPIELDRRIRELGISGGGTTGGSGTGGAPSGGGASSNLLYGYGSCLQNWTDVDFKTIFANFPKNSMGVVNGNFMFSFDAAIGWRVNGVDGYFRILFSMMGIATEENIRAQWDDEPNTGIGISSNNPSMDRFEGIFDTISMIYWGDTSTDFSNEPIKNTFGNTQHYLSLHGSYFDDTGLTPGWGGTTDVVLSSPITHFLKKKTFSWAPDWGYDNQFYVYAGKPFYVYPSLYISQLHTGYNFGLTINNNGYSTEDWSLFYNNTTLPPQKQIIYNWGFQKDNFKGWNSGQYSAPSKEGYGVGDPGDGGCGPAFRVDGGSPFPDPIASKIPDSWNTR